MKRSTLAAAAAVALAAALAPAALGDPSGVRITPLSHGTMSKVDAKRSGIRISTSGPRDMLVTSMSVAPGGTFGWHEHPGPVLVAISAGTLTIYEPSHGRCVRSTVGAGDAFVESGSEIHLARNEGSKPVRLNAIFLARTGTSEFLLTVPQPKGCDL